MMAPSCSVPEGSKYPNRRYLANTKILVPDTYSTLLGCFGPLGIDGFEFSRIYQHPPRSSTKCEHKLGEVKNQALGIWLPRPSHGTGVASSCLFDIRGTVENRLGAHALRQTRGRRVFAGRKWWEVKDLGAPCTAGFDPDSRTVPERVLIREFNLMHLYYGSTKTEPGPNLLLR